MRIIMNVPIIGQEFNQRQMLCNAEIIYSRPVSPVFAICDQHLLFYLQSKLRSVWWFLLLTTGCCWQARSIEPGLKLIILHAFRHDFRTLWNQVKLRPACYLLISCLINSCSPHHHHLSSLCWVSLPGVPGSAAACEIVSCAWDVQTWVGWVAAAWSSSVMSWLPHHQHNAEVLLEQHSLSWILSSSSRPSSGAAAWSWLQ